MLVHHRVTPQHSICRYPFIHLQGGDIHSVRVKCFACNRIQHNDPNQGLKPGLLNPEFNVLTIRPTHLHIQFKCHPIFFSVVVSLSSSMVRGSRMDLTDSWGVVKLLTVSWEITYLLTDSWDLSLLQLCDEPKEHLRRRVLRSEICKI